MATNNIMYCLFQVECIKLILLFDIYNLVNLESVYINVIKMNL